MTRPIVLRATLAAGLLSSLCLHATLAQEKTPSSKLLPPTVYAYVAAPDVAELKTRFKASAFGEMLNDPKLQPTYDQLKEKLSEGAGQVQQNLGVSMEDLLKVPSGELAFAVCDIPGESIGMVAILGHGENSATVDKLVEKAEASLEKKGATRTAEEFEGTEIVVYEKAAGAEEEEKDDLDIEGESSSSSGGPGKVAWFRKDGRFVIGNDVPVLEAVLARWDGNHGETFAASEVFQTVMEKTKTDDRAGDHLVRRSDGRAANRTQPGTKHSTAVSDRCRHPPDARSDASQGRRRQHRRRDRRLRLDHKDVFLRRAARVG